MGGNEGGVFEGLNDGDAVTVGVRVGQVLLATCKLCIDRRILDDEDVNEDDDEDDGCACSTKLCQEKQLLMVKILVVWLSRIC